MNPLQQKDGGTSLIVQRCSADQGKLECSNV
jgi:hypothetical protein